MKIRPKVDREAVWRAIFNLLPPQNPDLMDSRAELIAEAILPLFTLDVDVGAVAKTVYARATDDDGSWAGDVAAVLRAAGLEIVED